MKYSLPNQIAAFREGDQEKANYWQRFYSMFPAKWGAYGLPPVMKSALKHFDIDMGDPSPPYKPVDPRDHAQIGEFFRQIGLFDKGEQTEVSFTEVVSKMGRKDTFLR